MEDDVQDYRAAASLQLPQANRHKVQDRPSDAQLLSLPLVPGDMLVAATDGFFDNLFPEDVVKVINSKRKPRGGAPGLPSDVVGEDPALLREALASLATRLGRCAAEVAKSETKRTPFAVAAGKAGWFYEGGKVDDTTVVACVAIPEESC